MEITVIERRKQIEIEEQEIIRKSKELEATVKRPAEALKFKTETLAEGERWDDFFSALLKKKKNFFFANPFFLSFFLLFYFERQQLIKAAEAEAEAIRAKGTAEAAVLKAKGEAEVCLHFISAFFLSL